MAEPPYPEALPALTRLHWYVLERVLGQGGFGITYVAKDTNLDQRVAIKEYLPVEFATRLPDSTVRSRTDELRDRYRWGLERFIQEARTLARFDHPNIVRVLSVFEFNNTAYIVMRFEEGGTLAGLVDRRGTLPEAELLRILMQVLDGLELVHNAGFIHRDIKPDNIHIRGDGRPVLLDFGSARQAVGSSNTLTILIAPGYAPFEQYYNDPSSQGPWTDIYGLGATAYRAICGRAPLDAVSRSKGILGSTQEIMVPASVVGAGRYSGWFLAAIDHALAFAEKDRPQTIAEWRRELGGESAAPIATVPQRRAVGPAAASQTTVLVGAVTAAPSAEASRSPAPRVPPSHGGRETAQRSAPPWVWALMIIMVAIAAVSMYFAIKSKEDADRMEKRQEERQRKPPEPAPEQKQTPPPPSPTPPEEKKQEEGKPQGEPAPKAKPKPSPPQVPPKKEPAPVPTPTPTPKKEPVPAPKKEPGPPAPSPSAPKESPRGGEPPIVPPPKEVPAPVEKAPAARTTAELLADAEKAWSEQRYAEAIKTWEPLANAGNPRAQARMGDAYAEGRGVERDLKAAQVWYQKAAIDGDTSAMLKLGAMYENRKDPTGNYFAFIWYCTAAELGSDRGKAECEAIKSRLQPAEQEQARKSIKQNLDDTKNRKM